MPDLTFAFMHCADQDERAVILLARSIARLYPEDDSPSILLLTPENESLPVKLLDRLRRLRVHHVPFYIPEHLERFPLARNVFAASSAEAAAGTGILIWMDSDTVMLEQPGAMYLPPGKHLAACPVHLKNISSPADQPPDGFWKFLFEECRTPPGHIFTATTRVDRVAIRAHFNAGCLIMRADAGLMGIWKERFEQIIHSRTVRPFLEQSPLHEIFIHQAVLAAAMLAHLEPGEILLLPEEYNYPVFLQEKFNLTPPDHPVTLRYDSTAFLESGSAALSKWLPLITQLMIQDSR